MTLPLLATKTYVPRPRPRIIARRRLVERVNAGMHRKLTLVSAPAGFGKTTVVGESVAETDRPVAWLSIDEGDNDLSRFLIYLVAALQTVQPTIGEGLADALRSPQPPPTEAILTVLLNDIGSLGTNVVLVLDDYHLIDSPPIDDTLTFLLDHLPSHLHLVITTRQDPRFPLARLRARGEMTELRAADLRFTPDEAAAFLADVMGLHLSPADVASLETRTEGWIAGLQLAALSMQGRDDIPGFIQAFAGDDRYIVDYLVEEVLRRQSAEARAFLLQTSILDRLSGSLCDAVTGQAHGTGSAQLDAFERGNGFVVNLDDRRRWYRYHHLFVDVLHAHLMDEHPGQVPILHRRASTWFEHNGELSEAIRHARAGDDMPRAADLIEKAAPAMRRARQERVLLGWMKALPDDVVRDRPVLCVDYAGALTACGELGGVEARLRDAERWLDPEYGSREHAASAGMVVVNEQEFAGLPGAIAIYRAGLALSRGDGAATIGYAGRALEALPEGDNFRRGAAAGLLGLALWASGDLDAGHRMYTECMVRLRQAGFIADTFGCALALSDIRRAQGRLHEAMATYERALQLATEHGTPGLRGTADMHVGMGELCVERNDLDTAMRHLLHSKELGEHSGLPQNAYRWCVAMARVREAEGDLDGSLDLLDEAERRYVADFFPDVRPIPALKARMWIVQGKLGKALAWAREQGLSPDDDLSYLREFEHITLARILIARYRQEKDQRVIDAATGLLDRLLIAAEGGGRVGSAIEIMLLQALACEAQGDISRALAPFERALAVAVPEEYVRIVAGESAPMARLLSAAHANGRMLDDTARLLAACHDAQSAGEHALASRATSPAQALAEPLSPREIEVLHLIAEGLSNRQIGERLFLALDTVKGHNRRIFAKLGVQRRTEALSRARSLDLL